MTSLDLRNLVKKVKQGTLTDSDVRAVLKLEINEDNAYRIILILGHSGLSEVIPAIEAILIKSEDLDVKAKALQYLLVHHKQVQWEWMLHEHLKGSPLDFGEELRFVAVSTAGRLLSEKRDLQLLREVLNVFENTQDPIMKDASYDAILLASGARKQDLPGLRFETTTEPSYDNEVIKKMQKVAQGIH